MELCTFRFYTKLLVVILISKNSEKNCYIYHLRYLYYVDSPKVDPKYVFLGIRPNVKTNLKK